MNFIDVYRLGCSLVVIFSRLSPGSGYRVRETDVQRCANNREGGDDLGERPGTWGRGSWFLWNHHEAGVGSVGFVRAFLGYWESGVSDRWFRSGMCTAVLGGSVWYGAKLPWYRLKVWYSFCLSQHLPSTSKPSNHSEYHLQSWY